jgi:glycosyltransferase involved in cell wall biosynthesis
MSAAPTLSVCVVTQNFAHFLGRALGSVAPIADEIVVVDGGSTDRTREVVSRFPAARLVEHPFTGDIGAQKNFAFGLCACEWTLCIDSDEMLGPIGREVVRRAIRSTRYGFFKLPRYWLASEQPLCYVETDALYPDWSLRLFRTSPFFRYTAERKIHHRFPKEGRPPGRKLPFGHIFHFDFIFNDRARREAKVARYSALAPAEAETHRSYLYEDVPYRIRRCREPLEGEASIGPWRRLRLAAALGR